MNDYIVFNGVVTRIDWVVSGEFETLGQAIANTHGDGGLDA